MIARITCRAAVVFGVMVALGCNPERHWELRTELHALDVPDHVSNYLGVELTPPTRAQVRLGSHLFHDRQLSLDGSVSCASCHMQGRGFSDPNALSIGVNGGQSDRNAMALINLVFDPLLFWDGRVSSLKEQALLPVVHPLEMAETWPDVVAKLQSDERYPKMFFEAFGSSEVDSNRVAEALAAFETTLLSFDSPYDAFFYEGKADALNESAFRGFELFFGEAECVHCHAGPLLTDQTFKSNGLDGTVTDPGLGEVTGDAQDLGKFKVPTLRNIAVTGPYMHDGRFSSLMEVVEHYNSGVNSQAPNLDPDMHIYEEGLQLSEQDKLDLVAFMESFTDTTFLTNEAFSAPN